MEHTAQKIKFSIKDMTKSAPTKGFFSFVGFAFDKWMK